MNKTQTLIAKPHYLFPIRLLIQFYNQGKLSQVASIDVEENQGRVARIAYKNGSVRMIYGSGMGINNRDAFQIIKAKGYTKYFLNNLGYKTPVGKAFLIQKLINGLNKPSPQVSQNNNVSDNIYAYINTTLGYPCIIKPDNGLKGMGVHKCFNDLDIQTAIKIYEQRGVKTAIVEAFVDLPDYRVNTLGNNVMSCCIRYPLSVIGNGKSTIKELLLQKQKKSISQGLPSTIKINDPRIARKLQRKGFSFETVLPVNNKLALHDITNLSTGATAEDCTEKMHPRWEALCVNIVKDFGLQLSGIDFFCANIEDPNANYSIIEINGSPGLENYAFMGEKQTNITRDFHLNIFNSSNPNYTAIAKKLKQKYYFNTKEKTL